MYKVIRRFRDLQDGQHVYQVGDEYPRKFLVVKKERIEELLSSNNKMHTPLIKEVKSESVVDEQPVVEAKPKAKKSRKKKSDK